MVFLFPLWTVSLGVCFRKLSWTPPAQRKPNIRHWNPTETFKIYDTLNWTSWHQTTWFICFPWSGRHHWVLIKWALLPIKLCWFHGEKTSFSLRSQQVTFIVSGKMTVDQRVHIPTSFYLLRENSQSTRYSCLPFKLWTSQGDFGLVIPGTPLLLPLTSTMCLGMKLNTHVNLKRDFCPPQGVNRKWWTCWTCIWNHVLTWFLPFTLAFASSRSVCTFLFLIFAGIEKSKYSIGCFFLPDKTHHKQFPAKQEWQTYDWCKFELFCQPWGCVAFFGMGGQEWNLILLVLNHVSQIGWQLSQFWQWHS